MALSVQQLYQWRPLCRSWPLQAKVRSRVLELGCGRQPSRGRRAGIRSRDQRTRIININNAHRSAVRSCPPVIIGNRSFVVNQPIVRERYLTCLQRTPLLSPVKVGLFNARSVSKKSESIAAWVADLNLTAAGLVETWHDGPDTPSLVACAPPGYIYLERARPRSAEQTCNMSTNHGGVCLLYRDRLHARLVNTTQYTTFEHIAVFLHGSSLKSLFVVIYRPGSTAASTMFFDELADLVDHVCSYSSVIIMGDVNLHLDIPTDSGTVNFSSLLTANNLVQVVQSPTHSAGHLLDIVVTRSDTPVLSVNVPPPVLSDHSLIDVALGLLCSNHCALVPGNRRSWRSFNLDDFVRDLQQSTLVCSPPTDVDELVAAYDDTLKSLLDVHAPYRVVRQSTRQSQHWFDAECRAVKRSTRKLERAYRRHPTTDTLDAWKSQFSMQRHLFRQKATDYWSTTFADCRGDAKLLWSHINRATNPPTARRIPHTEHELATHFTSKVDKIRTSTSSAAQPDISVRHCAALSSFQHVTADEVRQLIRRAPCKHCALDPVPTWLLKRAIDVLAPTIAAVCNSSLQAGHFPDSQKQARLTARLKKPSLNPDDLNSFRPISNLTFLSKVVERTVVKQFTHHADLHGLFPPNQSAYRQFHSTESAVLLVHNDIVRAIDRGHVVALVLLDLSSAFDTVDHPTLLTILQSRFSVTNQPLQWFHSYLTGRTQVFTTHSSQTLPIPLTTGVPQGSSLGPTQFIAYTESTSAIFSSHSVQYHLFADDTQAYDHCEISAIPSLLARLSSCIDDLAQSFASLRLQLNPSKTEFIWFASHSNLPKIPDNCQSIRICESTVRSTDTVRDLGVFLDSELSMKHHISKTASACFFHLRRLRQIRGRVTDEVMMQLLSSLVLSRLDYCNVVLAGLPASTLQPLQKAQNAAARLMLGLDRRSHITPALKKLHWLPVKDRITFKVAAVMHQILNHRCPPYLTNLIDFNTASTHHRQLRSASTRAAVVLRSRTEFGKRAFSVCGPTVWNRLPPNLRAIHNHSAFRRGLKTHLFNLAF